MKRQLTNQQLRSLDRICESAAGDRAQVVGWLLGGPVLRFKNGGMALIAPDGSMNTMTRGARR